MRVIALAAMLALAACLPPRDVRPPVAEPTCVTINPIYVNGQEVVPYIHQCAPTA